MKFITLSHDDLRFFCSLMIEKNIFEIFFNFLFTFDEILDIIILALRQ